MPRIALVLSCLFGLLLAAPAFAHGKLERSTPRAGSVVKASPAEVRLWFTEKLEPAFSRVEVRNGAGERVEAGPVEVDAGKRSIVSVKLKPLAPGSYTVDWHVVSVDTHSTSGRFSFEVKPQ